jgi:hypothetical protein
MPISVAEPVEGARKCLSGVRQFADEWIAGAQFDDLECYDLLHGGRSGYRYRWQQ